MSAQIRFFVVRNDLEDLLQFAEQQGFCALPQIIETDSTPSECLPTQFKPDSETGREFFYLLPKGFAAVEAFYTELMFEPWRSKLVADTSPVIEISPGTAGSLEPVEGRMYHCQDKGDPRYTETSKGFCQLKRFVKDQWVQTTDGKFYFGRLAAKLCRSGKAKVFYGGNRLEVSQN